MKKSLSFMVGILSMIIGVLVVVIFDMANMVVYDNIAISILIHFVLLIGVIQFCYFGSIIVAKSLTKFIIWRGARKELKQRKKMKKRNERKGGNNED